MTIKNCRYCGNEFTATNNAQQYCPTCKKEGRHRNRKYKKVAFREIPYICAYCGTKFTGRKKKYCCNECRLLAHGRVKPKTRKKPKNFMSIEEVARASKEMGISAGEYMTKFCYKKEGE